MKIAVAMSGGVDSSVAAASLKQAGHEVLGLTMKLWFCAPDGSDRMDWDGTPAPEGAVASAPIAPLCCSPRDARDAQAVCERLGIEHRVVALAGEFSAEVIDPFVAEYLRGRTPNPCTRCNQFLKFQRLAEEARRSGCQALATGHYARADRDASGRFLLRTAADASRDQSYFLFAVTQAELAFLRFPLGDLSKGEVRRRAAEAGLGVAGKPDSQEVCFIPDQDHRRFLRERRPEAFRPGPIMHLDGRPLGEHSGLPGFTIGQRKGLGVAYREPLYVVALDAARNAVVLGPESALLASGLEARATTWVAGAPPAICFRASAKIRYRNPPTACRVETADGGTAAVRFDSPVRAITPGQSVVFYDGDLVLGGGVIERAR